MNSSPWNIHEGYIARRLLRQPLLQTIAPVRVVSLLAFAISLVWTPPALAQYRPPQGSPPGGPSLSNGSRGTCDNSDSIPLTVIAPNQHVGRTLATNPTLVWFVPMTTPYRLHVSLYTADVNAPELVQEFNSIEEESGLVQFTFPNSETTLNPGQRYIWQVAFACDPESPMFDQTLVAELDVVDASHAIAEELETAQTPLEQVKIYAQQGYWYDALREAIISSEASNNLDTLTELISDLARLEDSTYSEVLQQIIEQLSQPEDITL